MQNDILVKSFHASGAIPGNRIVTLGTNDNTVKGATGSSETLIGVTHNTDAQDGKMADVVLAGAPMVKAGAAITKGTYVTSDANSKAIAVADGTDRTIGMTLEGASEGDLVPILLSQA